MENVFTTYIKDINSKIKETLNGRKTISVSNCIAYLKPEFDSDAKAAEMVAKYFDNPDHKYYQMSKEQILELWDNKKNAACDRGSLFDSYVEQVVEIRDPEKYEEWKLTHDIENDQFMYRAMSGFRNIIDRFAKIGYTTIVGTEIPLFMKNSFNSEEIINGRCDCLLYNPATKHFMIVDWKTNEAIKTRGFEKMYGPMKHYPSCEYYAYMIQVFLYKKSLIETYKLGTQDTVHVAVCQMGIDALPYYQIYNDSQFAYTDSLLNDIIKYAYMRKSYKEKQAENNK